MQNHYPDDTEVEQIRENTREAVNRSIDHASVAWRNMANEALYHLCKTQETLTVHDLWKIVEKSKNKTHSKLAIGGVMRLAAKNKWIEKTGEKVLSKLAHGVEVQIWKSLIFGKTDAPVFIPSKRFTFGRYVVMQRENGERTCNCDGYRFRKTCQHIDQVVRESEPKLFV